MGESCLVSYSNVKLSSIRIFKPGAAGGRFICSSNNNISRITKMVQSLCKQYSPTLVSLPDPDGAPPSSPLLPGEDTETQRTYHPFPHPSVLSGLDVGPTLRSLGFGYRAEFIQRTAKMLVDAHAPPSDPVAVDPEASEKWLLTLRNVDTAVAREELLKFVGVGRKVADCVLLMSLDKVVIHLFSSQLCNSLHCTERRRPRRYSRPPNCHQTLRASWPRWQKGEHDASAVRSSKRQTGQRLGRLCWLGSFRKYHIHISVSISILKNALLHRFFSPRI